MTNQTKPITFTLNQTQRLAEAMVGADLAEGAKAAAFKLINRKVRTLADIPRAKEAFNDAAVVYAANKYVIEIGIFMHAVVNGSGTDKIKGVPVRTMRDLVHKTRNRWMGYYKKYLLERVVDSRAAGATKKKRATKGAVKPKKPVDTVELKQAPETTPVKRAIEQVSSIPRTVLTTTNWSDCEDGLRQEIEIAALQLVELLSKIK
jgi:hypothetical protein